MLTIIIPVRNEAENVEKTFNIIKNSKLNFSYEVLFINDFSEDQTYGKIKNLEKNNTEVKVCDNSRKGLGGAITTGIEEAKGDYTCIMMADLSDDIEDLKKYYELMNMNEIDAVFGSRFLKASKVVDYPKKKLILNRIFNFIVKLIFFNSYNDYTNAFKIYKTSVIKSIIPLVSESFNVFLEMPLKLISRNYKMKIIPINWTTRKEGKAKFDIKELRSKYLFTLIYCFVEKILLGNKK